MSVLSGKPILVTRPAHQADTLCRLIAYYGGNPVRFPTLQIDGLKIAPAYLGTLDRYHIAIFTSANAVEFAVPAIERQRPWPRQWRVAAIGTATAAKLEEYRHPADIIPDSDFNSEALLAHPALHDVSHLHILIVRGEGGRELLAEHLRKRGADVEYLEVYRRSKPKADPQEVIDSLKSGQLAFITANSAEALQNLVDLLDPRWHPLLLNIPLVVASQKTIELASTLGFRAHVFLSANAKDQSIIDTLIRACG